MYKFSFAPSNINTHCYYVYVNGKGRGTLLADNSEKALEMAARHFKAFIKSKNEISVIKAA